MWHGCNFDVVRCGFGVGVGLRRYTPDSRLQAANFRPTLTRVLALLNERAVEERMLKRATGA